MLSRNRIERVRRGCLNTPALYKLSSFPQNIQVEVYKRFPEFKEQEASKSLVESVEIDGAAAAFFEDYTYGDSKHLPASKQDEYTNSASILNLCRTMLEQADSQRARVSKPRVKKGEFWSKVSKALPRLSDTYRNSLPSNPRRLQEKFNQYFREGYICFIDGKFGNANASKVSEEERETLLLFLCTHHNKLDNALIADLYNSTAVKMLPPWETITAGTVANFRTRHQMEVALKTDGASAFSNRKAMQVKRSRPTSAMLMWTLDGWTCELYYQKAGDGATTYHNRVTLEVVLDPCCDYPIGYAVGEQENSALIRAALEDAMRHTAELFGSMYKTNQLQSDHFLDKKMDPIYTAVADKVIPAKARNAKSKVIEPYFGYLNDTYCRLCDNWSGYGSQSRKENQPSSESRNLLKKEFPDLAGVLTQIDNMMAGERAAKREQYMKLWEGTPADRRLPMSRESFLLNFGRSNGYRNALEGSGLHPTIEGVKMSYDCFDKSFRRHADVRWSVLYDAQDLKSALAVSEDGTLRYMLEEKYVQPMALADRKEGDYEQLERVRKFNEELTADVKEMLAINERKTREIFAHVSLLDNTLGKHLLTDSKGQHKSQRERMRLLQQNTEVVEAVEVENVHEAHPEPVGEKTERFAVVNKTLCRSEEDEFDREYSRFDTF